MSSVFGGFSKDIADCYGKPHINARYTADNVDSYEKTGDRCFMCGNPAAHVHHWPPKGYARTFTLRTPMGMFILKPALFALCPRCHFLFHEKKVVKAKWVWNREEYASQWFDGTLLSHGFESNSPRLYDMGHWEIVGLDEPIVYKGEKWTN